MKKKIKELTDEEHRKFCEKYLKNYCKGCPLKYPSSPSEEVEVDE